MSEFTKRVPAPARTDINTGVEPIHVQTVLTIFGQPRGVLTDDCEEVDNPILKALIVTQSVGKFRVTGLRPAVISLRDILAEVDSAKPDLFSQIGSAGMLCCRRVRGSRTTPSNHAFGLAVDLTIGGQLDDRGDGKTQAGLLEIYRFFHSHGWYWGAGFPTEDSMHFEAGDQLVRRWALEGQFGVQAQKNAKKLV